jgi:hypothetical protein
VARGAPGGLGVVWVRAGALWVCGRPVWVCGERDRTTAFTDYLVSKFIDHYDTVCAKL